MERYAFWSNEALGNFIIGGDIAGFIFGDIEGPLENEEATHHEISVTADWGWGNAIVTGYDTHFDNFIFLELRPGVGFQPTATYVGREARIRGLEGLARFMLWEGKGSGQKVELEVSGDWVVGQDVTCLLYTSPSPRDQRGSRMPSSA